MSTTTTSSAPLLDIEATKKIAALRAVEEHFLPTDQYVGIGSGTTITYVVEAIKARAASTNRETEIKFVPTGYQSRHVIVQAGLTPIAFDSLPDGQLLDVAFDGADEVDDDLNCIKGGGACLFQEKLVATKAKKFICVADYRKLQPRLLTSWPTIPIEVAPIAVPRVLIALRALGSPSPTLRENLLTKAGPVKTDQDFFIIDAPFAPLLTAADVASSDDPDAGTGTGKGASEDDRDGPAAVNWEVQTLAKTIKMITGVLDVGIFSGINGVQAGAQHFLAGGEKPVAAYFGMQDGSVEVRRAKELL
ncbi:MAG: hypothetical protein M1819_005949 [Sarea resinae]|nr:MAG: hypothetical protein M1819_005949 [Sarea resinae]